jgi:DNA-binding NtrC family response regulator
MGPDLQVKLLRVLEAKSVRRVGGTQDLHVDVRLVSATNREPLEAIKDGKLREDLYYRLNVFPIALPPLSDRREDVAPLAEHFRRHIEEQEKAGVTRWDPAALAALEAYAWPGNVRELRNVVHRAYVMTEGDTIRPEVVEELLPGQPAPAAASDKKPARKR